ncbi:hypothetical protein JOC77_001046 [Peribacillus deserti]|uniref:ANTAR domain-containing protein n=1 Tax=Peribacillus deserti TaxID=673318 RepID=A0ABS2QG33_9BACI|nr:hypothetical protein [Peribacillus deserti]MBM7691639.1 hypothetical protein [Peribacillus deserti]
MEWWHWEQQSVKIIPIPVVGTLIGSFTTSTLINLSKKHLAEKEEELSAKLKEIYNEALSKIAVEHQKIVNLILEEYNRLGTITKMAFDLKCNAELRFNQSIRLAKQHDIEEAEVLKTVDEVDLFFLS